MIQTIIGNKTVNIEDIDRQKCEIWSRVMGYFRPTSHYNPGKLQEHKDRKFFK